jgi:hypothetical protein
VLVDLSGPEDALAERETVLAELLLGGEPFGVRLEVSTKGGPSRAVVALAAGVYRPTSDPR